jgi:hypothetical protein
MANLKRMNDIKDDNLIDEILTGEIVIFEDIQGSKIYINWDGKNFSIKPKSLSYDPINLVDLAMQNYYNLAINYFESLDRRVKALLNKNWWFGFEYFPDNQPANIEYSKTPKNNLVLTSICKGSKFSYTMDELEEYSRLLEVDCVPILFKGKLNEKTIEAIKYFLNTSEKDLEFVFGEKSFAYFFYKLLSPNTTHSFLMEEDFQKNCEKLIIRLEDKETSFEILNPLYKRISDTNSTDFIEIYTLILINFLNFSQSIDIDNLKIKGSRRDDSYIYIICKIFNMYISEVKDDLKNFDFIIPEFFDKDKFRINMELIPNKLTRDFIQDEKKIEYIFKVILGSFNRKKKKPIGLFTEATVQIFNRFLDKLDSIIDKYLNKKSEIELTRSGLLDFGEYFDIKIDKDGDGEVYPDVYTEIEKTRQDKSKGKKEGKPVKFTDVSDKDMKF